MPNQPTKSSLTKPLVIFRITVNYVRKRYNNLQCFFEVLLAPVFVKIFQDIQETVLRLVRTADQLLRRTHLDAEGVRQRLQAVDEESENFMIKLDTRRKNISTAMSFFGLAETVSDECYKCTDWLFE